MAEPPCSFAAGRWDNRHVPFYRAFPIVFFSSRGASFREKIGPSGVSSSTRSIGGRPPPAGTDPRKATASSGQASYPLPRRKRQVSLTPLSLLPPQKLGTAFAGPPVYGGLLTATRRLSCAAAADAIVTFQIFCWNWRRLRHQPCGVGGGAAMRNTQAALVSTGKPEFDGWTRLGSPIGGAVSVRGTSR